MNSFIKKSKPFLICLVSAFLLITAYPQLEFWYLAWIALVPLFFAIEGVSKKRALWLGWFFGFVFFFGTLGWLWYVTPPGAILLCIYLAFYPAVFCASTVFFQKLPLVSRVIVLSCVWTVLEFLRSILFTGFGWVTLGHSQYKSLLLIQISDVIGLFGISFLVIMVNLVVFETIKAIYRKQNTKNLQALQIVTIFILWLCLGYGILTLKNAHFPSSVKVAVVQPNIPQSIKWEPQYMPLIVQKTLDLSEQAAKHHPDIILWPETSLPGVLSEQPAYFQQIQLKAMDLKTPILMGAISMENNLYYNSAILIGRDGKIEGHYKKIHLVPFGEFLPLRPILGWINQYIGLEDFTSGQEYTLFSAGQKGHKFGVLICFEDTLNDLWRNFTNAGGRFFMNITNDAWFMDTKAPFLHLQSAVMECVMNKRSLVRAANTGVSGFIDPLGRITNLAQDARGKKTFVSAVAISDIKINEHKTFYTKFGELFTCLCFVCILWGVWTRRKYAKKSLID